MFRGGKVCRFSRMATDTIAKLLRWLLALFETFPPVYENVCHARNFSTAEHFPFTVRPFRDEILTVILYLVVNKSRGSIF